VIIKEIKRISKLQIYFIFKLRNELYVRNSSINKKKINFKTHIMWIKNFIKNKNKIFLIKKNRKNIGYVRMEKNNNSLNVSWAIDEEYRGIGYMTKCLKKVTKSSIKNISIFKAFILKENIASIKVAKKSGFKRIDKKRDYYIYGKILKVKKA
jgi:RimJ/RimL family protein N-acetyltransferase